MTIPDLPQLRMGYTRFDELPAPDSAPGYGLRTFRPGDEDAWIAMLNAGDLGTWDRERLDLMLANQQVRAPRDGIFFVTHHDRPVGTACTLFHPGTYPGQIAQPSGPDGVPELGWVAVDPLHRGHRLGRQVCRAVLAYVRDLGHRYTYLLTDDFRLPAIQTYLRLGFEPELIDPSHPGRWASLHQALARHDNG